MRSLRELESDAQMEVPRPVGSNIKALMADEKYRLAMNFLRDALCGVDRLSFALPDDPAVMGWRQGRRFPWLQWQAIADAPMPTETPPEPPARTATEKQRRRATKIPKQTKG